MSIKALNWAFGVRDLKPAPKLILVFLADCHNGHTGQCDPQQTTLAENCGMSRSTVNVHLNDLEDLGLIKRIQRSDKRTRKQENTFYILACNEDETEGAVSGNRTRKSPRAVSGNRTRKSPRAVSGNRTRETSNPVSGKSPIPCPEKRDSRVRTVGHKPELNQNGTLRAGTRPRARGTFFTDDEKFQADQVVDHIRGGGTVIADQIPQRIRDCIVSLGLLTDDEIETHGISEKGQGDG